MSLTSTTAVALWFDRFRGAAIGLSNAVPSPPDDATQLGWTRPEAERTLMLWAVTGAVAASGMITTRLAFHQISLLGERGLTATQAAANFVLQTAAAITRPLRWAWLVDRVAPRLLVAASMGPLAAAMVLAQTAAPGLSAAAIDLVDELAAAREQGDEAAADRHLQRLRRALQRLRHDTDRLVAGRGGDLTSLRRQPTNLATLVRRVVSAHLSGRHPITIDLAAVVLNVDSVKVERIVDNLLHNALRHTPPHCPVSLELGAAPVGALLVVEDEGPGLPHHLCDALARDTDDPDAFAGAVGLWLVKRFARLHGGDLTVRPNVHGRPARFEVWLPARGDRPEPA